MHSTAFLVVVVVRAAKGLRRRGFCTYAMSNLLHEIPFSSELASPFCLLSYTLSITYIHFTSATWKQYVLIITLLNQLSFCVFFTSLRSFHHRILQKIDIDIIESLRRLVSCHTTPEFSPSVWRPGVPFVKRTPCKLVIYTCYNHSR